MATSLSEIILCDLGDRIQDSNVSDMKFGWLDLFASRMSSYLNIAIVKVLYEIRFLSGKSYWEYGCK
ncbi:hypothetical protein POTOM_057219 [Populus tomentosa]|uniref:Uncharacterized protein n=1 Tax=Populus tomentosa TaxID=118781 RepID=A0A8X7XYJ1_POPTO|nr:hypothetical protein POTOM_057219 [Populus tomentosa]